MPHFIQLFKEDDAPDFGLDQSHSFLCNYLYIFMMFPKAIFGAAALSLLLRAAGAIDLDANSPGKLDHSAYHVHCDYSEADVL